MDARADTHSLVARPIEVLEPPAHMAPIVFASPHSGKDYPPEFVSASHLDPLTLRRSEDAYVDELFAAAPAAGAPLLRALFPRAFVDPNREPYELDPAMFEGVLPEYANTSSPRVAAGLGTIARVVCSGAEIYGCKLGVADALDRIEAYYRPYHRTLNALIEATKARFGHALLFDCHSMPSVGGPMDKDPGLKRVDFVLGDCHGAACDRAISDFVEDYLKQLGYVVTRNAPYAGGFTTRHYGQPDAGVHVLQIEINRALYMDEATYDQRPYFPTLTRHMSELVNALTTNDWSFVEAHGNGA